MKNISNSRLAAIIVCFTVVVVIAYSSIDRTAASSESPVGGAMKVVTIESGYLELQFVPADDKHPTENYLIPYSGIKQVRISEDENDYRLTIYFSSIGSDSDRSKTIVKVTHREVFSSFQINGRVNGFEFKDRQNEIELFLNNYKSWLNRK
ncbi:MAG: hypothetical protein ACE37H_01285 [Phycisphaeraceae bacterium]